MATPSTIVHQPLGELRTVRVHGLRDALSAAWPLSRLARPRGKRRGPQMKATYSRERPRPRDMLVSGIICFTIVDVRSREGIVAWGS